MLASGYEIILVVELDKYDFCFLCLIELCLNLQHPDHYSRTKSIAEKKVLSVNGTDKLCTCALRLAGVYGPGEKRHIPRTLVIIIRFYNKCKWTW